MHLAHLGAALRRVERRLRQTVAPSFIKKPRRLIRLAGEQLEPRLALSTLPAGFQENLIAGGLYEPTAMTVAPDGRIFVTEKPFGVRVVKDGTLLQVPFVSLSVERNGERGVNGIVLDPDFASNRFMYVYYTHKTSTGSFDRLSRFTGSATNPDVADPASERVLLDGIPTVTPGYHNGGVLEFGADGMLYVGIGDTNDTSLPQDLSKLQGKILRINPAEYPNIIPSDNPYVGQVGKRGEIWASGFRNPFTGRMRPGTSQLFINDVGSGLFEEVNRIVKAGNYGWPLAEGMSGNSAFMNPHYAYAHNGQGAAITGGEFYTGAQFPAAYSGKYFFSDYVRGFIRTLDANTGAATEFATGVYIPVDVAMSPDGGLYWLSLGAGSDTNGAIYRISYVVGNRQPTAVASASPVSGLAPLTVKFTGAASSDPDSDALYYAWNFGDGQTGTGRDVTHTYVANGQYAVTLTVNDRGDASGLSSTSMPLLVTVGNQAPAPTIGMPSSGNRYSAGDTIFFAGNATDPEDGSLAASALKWSIVFHHNTHTHPYLDPISGAGAGSFQIPLTGEPDPDQWYRITLTATDSGGLSQSTYVDVLPNTSTITLASNVAGAQLSLDGQPLTATSIVGVVGMQRVLSAPLQQTIAGKTYQFSSWSHGGPATHTIITPATATTFTANYTSVDVPLAAVYSTIAPQAWLPGQIRTFTTTLTNTGTQTWNAAGTNPVHLGIYFSGNSDAIYDWQTEPARVALPLDVAPGQTISVSVTARAPVTAGSYVLRQRLVKEFVQWFEQLHALPVQVDSLIASYATNVPAVWQPGETKTFLTTVTNTGTATWNANDPEAVHLGVYFEGNSDAIYDWRVEPMRFMLPQDVAPGQSATIAVTIAAPGTAGSYVLRQRLVKEGVAWLESLTKTTVTIGTTALAVTAVSPGVGASSVLTTSLVTAQFSQSINPATLTSSTFLLYRLGTTTPVAASVNFDSATGKAVLRPASYLAVSTIYTAVLKGGAAGIKTAAGSMLAADYAWSFVTTATPANRSQFISQSVPTTMRVGQTYSVSVTVKNTGTKTWNTTSYRLGSANPRDNFTWGRNRVSLSAPVAPGSQVTFKFSVRAPRTAGVYNFQWQMLEEQIAWFGALTPSLKITVI